MANDMIERLIMNDKELSKKYGLRIYRANHMDEVFTYTDIIDLLFIKIKIDSHLDSQKNQFDFKLKFDFSNLD